MPIFQQSVDAELYEWLLEEQKKRRVRSVQEVIRQILSEAKAEVEAFNLPIILKPKSFSRLSFNKIRGHE